MTGGSKGKAEVTTARLVRIFVIISAAVILTGLILYLVTGMSGYDNGAYPINPLAILAGAAAIKPYAVMMTGILILVVTPFLRVGASVILFLKEKDFLYVGISAAVFVILLISLILGKAE